MANANINLMILGQTGSGKSTLINYLHGSKVVEAGAGPPVTNRGEFASIPIPSPIKPDVNITILDSWGLESGKAEEWEDLISKRLTATLSYADMVYGVVYCLSYSQDRIQDFEIRMLKKLLAKGYKIVIALTNADNSGFTAKQSAFKCKLNNELPEYRHYYGVADVCAESKKKIGQLEAKPTFGKDELLAQIERDVSVKFRQGLHGEHTGMAGAEPEKNRRVQRRAQEHHRLRLQRQSERPGKAHPE